MHNVARVSLKRSTVVKYHIVLLLTMLLGCLWIKYVRTAFKFGRRVHFALRRKMLKPPIARLPAI